MNLRNWNNIPKSTNMEQLHRETDNLFHQKFDLFAATERTPFAIPPVVTDKILDSILDFIHSSEKIAFDEGQKSIIDLIFPNGLDDPNIDLSSYGWIIELLKTNLNK